MTPQGIAGLRVELVVLFFGRLTDLKRIERVLWALSYPERKQVIKRLGWLNL